MSLQTYQEKFRTKVFNKYFAFFAFNKEQFYKSNEP